MFSVLDDGTHSLRNGNRDNNCIQLPVALGPHLRLFKGSKLAVLMALALHSDEDGQVAVSDEVLSAETGYHKATIAYTIIELCHLRINSRLVLVRRQQNELESSSSDNSYLLFPREELCSGFNHTALITSNP